MKKMTQEDFIKKVSERNLPYSFDKFEYKGNAIKGVVACPRHGEFLATPNSIFNGCGCPPCGLERRGKVRQTRFDEFVKKAHKAHDGKYTYTNSNWGGIRSRVEVHCPEHQRTFTQMAYAHAEGQVGCPVCKSEKMSASRATPQEDFIKKCQEAHGDTYDYSKIIYKKSMSKIIVICKTHGEFYPQAGNFINNKSGCPVCARERVGALSRHSFESYLARFREVHGDRFIYHGVNHSGTTTTALIECAVHGRFEQSVQDHLRGVGCIKCSFKVWDQETFLASAKEVHGDTYDYSKSVYKKALEKVTITCKVHGDFLQTPSCHISAKQGCRQCSDIGPSLGQREVFNFLSEFTEARMDYRFDGRKELDIYLPELNLGIEFNGLIWHSTKFSKSLHHMAEKLKLAEAKGIRVIHLYQDEWESSRPTVEKMLRQAVGVSPRVFARKTSCRGISSEEANTFLESNHLRGKVSGSFDSYGLFDEHGSLLAVMVFSRVTSNRGTVSEEHTKELRRYSASCAVVGGPSKLLNHYLKDNPKVKEVVTYSENRAFTGNVYRKLGFNHVADVNPDYWYVSPASRKRHSKSKFRRSNLPTILGEKFNPALSEVENCVRSGWYRLFDCGKKKWVFRAK